MTIHRVKGGEIWELGVLVEDIRGTFDLIVFELFGALVSKWLTTRKMLTIQLNGLKFETRVILEIHIWDSIELVFYNVVLGSFRANVPNVISSNICAKFTTVLRIAVVKQSAKAHGPLVKRSGVISVYSVPIFSVPDDA